MKLTRATGIVGGLLAAVATLGCKDSVTPPAPLITVTAVSPATGPLGGGTAVRITGTNFTDVTSVTIGGSELGYRTVVSTTEITGTAPAATSPGPKGVVVTSSSHGSGICSGCFSYESVNVIAAALAAGGSHTCALTSAGAAYCWGFNHTGELGNGSWDLGYCGTIRCSLTPVAVSGGLRISALAAGGNHTCALDTSGAPYCWGSNEGGQLGNGSTAAFSLIPVAVSGGFTFGALAAGGGHTCGLTSTGAAACWGWNGAGQLGDGSTTNRSIPVAVSGGLSFSTLVAGGGHTCALTSAGAVYCWGSNAYGQLGDGSTTTSGTPVAVSGGLSFNALAAGGEHTCGLTSAGAAYCWGSNFNAQLGNGSTTPSATPVAVSGGLSFSALVAGWGHTCARTRADAALYCWGSNEYGQLAVPWTWWAPAPVSGDLTFSGLAAREYRTCGLVGPGLAYCWGDGFDRTPVAIPGGLTFSALAIGWYHQCGLSSAGATYCWGSNYSGELGDGSTTNSSIPVAVSGGFTFSALTAGWGHTCGLTGGGAAYCWGSNVYGELGTGSASGPDLCGNRPYPCSVTPIAVSGGLTFTTLAAGNIHTCALTTSGAAYCWGFNYFGQLGTGSASGPDLCGDGPYPCSVTPLAVSGGLSFIALAAGRGDTCGLTSTGATYCWGWNGLGGLGDGSFTDRATPVPVSGGLRFSALAAGDYHTCGLTSAGAAYCWGSNGQGELGIGRRTSPTSTPIAVAGGLSFSTIAAGLLRTCGLTSAGAAYCWGDNSYGRLGIPNYSTVPVAVVWSGASAQAAIVEGTPIWGAQPLERFRQIIDQMLAQP